MRSPAPTSFSEFFGKSQSKSFINNKIVNPSRILKQRGMTLVEVIVGVLILALVAAGALTVVTTSYQISAKTRLSDNARAVLRTYGDQFLTMQPLGFSDAANLIEKNPQEFQDLRADPTYARATITNIPIGAHGATDVKATITRSVSFVEIATGADATSGTQDQAGYLRRATFTATYPFAGKTQSVSFTLMSAVVTQ